MYKTNLIEFGDELFFIAESGFGRELWRSDGTTIGTGMVKDIAPGFAPSTGLFREWLFALDDTLYFVADDGQTGAKLWKTDGTDGGTQLVRDINTTGAFGRSPSGIGSSGVIGAHLQSPQIS